MVFALIHHLVGCSHVHGCVPGRQPRQSTRNSVRNSLPQPAAMLRTPPCDSKGPKDNPIRPNRERRMRCTAVPWYGPPNA